MYAAHLAVGLGIKAAAPKAPTWAVLGAAFLPDLFWLTFSKAGIEPVGPGIFFDGWSHSVLSIVVQALAVGLLSLKLERSVALALGGAVLSHLPLDIPIHPRALELYPHSLETVGVFFKSWGVQLSWLGKSHYWWVEADITLVLLVLYALLAVRAGFTSNVVLASAILVGWIQVMFG
jgi:hypothetical protein